MTEEHKRKIGESNSISLRLFYQSDAGKKIRKEKSVKMTGVSRPDVSKSRLGKFKGKDNPNWKGGIYAEHLIIRHSKEMKNWRIAVFKRDNYTCQKCAIKSSKGIKAFLHADHIKPFAYFPNLRFDIDNGRTLCAPCHRKTDTWGHASNYKPNNDD